MKNELIHMGNLKGGKWENTIERSARFYNPNGISPTLTTLTGGQQEVKIGEVMPRLVGGIGEMKSNGGTQFYQQDRIYASDTVAMAHPAQIPGGSYMYAVEEEIELFENSALEERERENGSMTEELCVETVVRVRRLTPKECYRLMGFSDEDFDRAKAVVSDGQLYRQAGNSIVVDVLEAIFTNLKPYFMKEAV